MRSKNSLVIVVPSLKAGGLERQASILANSLARRGFKISLICLGSTLPHYTLDNRVDLAMLKKKIANNNKLIRFFRVFFWLRKLVKKSDCATVLSYGEGYNAFVIASLIGLNRNVFVFNRASPISSLKGLRRRINPFFYKHTKAVFVQTHQAVELLSPVYKKTHFEVIQNSFILPKGGHIQTPKENIILNVGSIGGEKNQDWLIRYFAQLDDWKDWKLYFVGDGSKRAYCEQMAFKLGISDNVVFTGIQKNVVEYYKRAKIFAFVSSSEGLPNVLGEAMAFGLPVISFDCVTGPSELIDNDVNGFLIEENDTKQYIEKLTLLMQNETLRLELGTNARLKMKEFEENKVVDRTIKLLFDL